LPEKYFTSKKKLFTSIRAPCDLQKIAVCVNLGAVIFKSKHVGRHFCSYFQGILEVLRDLPGFQRIFFRILWDFSRILTKTKLLEYGCTLCNPASYTSGPDTTL